MEQLLGSACACEYTPVLTGHAHLGLGQRDWPGPPFLGTEASLRVWGKGKDLGDFLGSFPGVPLATNLHPRPGLLRLPSTHST